MSTITFTCPHCSHSVQLPVDTLGKQGNCPGCKTMVQIVATPQQPLPQQPQQQPLQQQPLPQQPLQNSQIRGRSGNRNKLIAGSAVGIVILLITISLFFLLGGNGSANVAGTTSGTSNNTNAPTANGENVEIPPAPRSLEEVGELWLKALKATESSERNGLAILSTLTWKEDEIKLAFEGYMRTDSPIPLAELTEAKERELFLRFSEDLKNSPNGWRKILNVEKVAFSRNTSSWTHRVLTRVKWSEMKLLATVKSREPRISDDFGGLKMYSIVLYLSNGDELFWLRLDEAFQVDAVGEKWFYGDDLRNGRLRKGGTKSNYVDFVLKELRKRDDSSLSKLISTLETLTPSGERRESSESVPPTESEIVAALHVAKNEQFQEITLRGVPLTTKILSQLQEIPSITVLDLSKSQLVDIDMIQLVGLKNLKRLYLRDNLLTESGIKHLSKMVSLEYLYLGNNPLGDKAIDHLVKMTNLRTLALDNTRVSPRGRAGLRNSLPHCDIFP